MPSFDYTAGYSGIHYSLQEFVAGPEQAAEFCNGSGLAGIARGICRAKAPVRLQCDGVRDSAAAEPTLESVRLSVDRERDLSTALVQTVERLGILR